MLATTLVGRVLSIFLSICSILIIAVVPGVITSYYVESTKLRADESSAKFLDDLERLPELSKRRACRAFRKGKKFNRKSKFNKCGHKKSRQYQKHTVGILLLKNILTYFMNP